MTETQLLPFLEPSAPAIVDLRATLAADRVRTDAQSLATYGRDWTKHYDIHPSAIVFPESAEEVSLIVKWANINKIGLVPSGGRTGLSGGACALNGEVVVSFEKMNRILDLNAVDRTVRVQAGVVTEQLQDYLKEQGYFYPVDFAAVGSSQIGGNIATNAGGVKVLRYGLTRDWVASLKVVTGQGEILELNHGLIKNATGYDFRHLFIGSEGTLGLICEASIKFTTPPQPLSVMVLGVPDLQAIMKIFKLCRENLPLTAFEFFSDHALKIVTEHTHLQRPFETDCPNYLLVEIENTETGTEERILTLFEQMVETGLAIDGAIAQSESQARDFWRLREDISESLSPFTPYKNDVSVSVTRVPEFLEKVDAALKANYPDFEVIWFGHIGDGNMHINILKPAGLPREKFLEKCVGVNAILFPIIQELDGSISAEHGVGLVKKAFLSYTRSLNEIALMKGVKLVFDPNGIMNPGKIF